MVEPASAAGIISQQKSYLEKLPPELVVYLTDFLPPSSTTRLSLTNSTFYQLIRERCNPELNTYQERLNFLNCLSRDLPQYLPCHGWVNPKLYLWQHQRNLFYHCDHCDRNVNHRIKYWRRNILGAVATGIPIWAACRASAHGNVVNTDCMSFGGRMLALRHAMLGPEYGCSAAGLACNCEHVSTSTEAVLMIKATPKIVRGGHLMIHKTVKFTSKSTDVPLQMVVCPHTQMEALYLIRFAIDYVDGEKLPGPILDGRLDASHNISIDEARQPIEDNITKTTFPTTNKWHRYSKLLKCEFCATDARLLVRKTIKSSNNTTTTRYQHIIHIYHDFGNLYTPMTTPQRQLIDVTENIPKIQAKYPTPHEFYERLLQDLEAKWNEPIPLNIKGTAVGEMEMEMRQITVNERKRKEMVSRGEPRDVLLFSHLMRKQVEGVPANMGGNDNADGVGTNSNITRSNTSRSHMSRRSPGFKKMVGMCGEAAPCSCPAEIWYMKQEMSGLAHFEPIERN